MWIVPHNSGLDYFCLTLVSMDPAVEELTSHHFDFKLLMCRDVYFNLSKY